MAIGGARVDCHKVLLNPGFFEESFVTLNMFASFQRGDRATFLSSSPQHQRHHHHHSWTRAAKCSGSS
jgi:hypothetical protein